MKNFVILFFLVTEFSPAVAAADNVVAEYALAQKCYHDLDKTQSFGWSRCIRKMEKIVEQYPTTDYARKAIFSVARLSHEKYGLDAEIKDLERAFTFYNRLLRDYPKDSMADDCLLEIAKLREERQSDRGRALKALQALLDRYPNGDKAPEAFAYLQTLNAPQKPQTQNVPPSPADVIQTIVIDPGHGGDDPGAKGPSGTKEAEVVLQIARKLAFLLSKQLNLGVHLTRTNTRGLSLEERARLANTKKADLFISIHANAHALPSVRGIQTFYLNNATSEAAKELAERENKVAGRELSLPERILTTLLQNANTLESRDLAHSVQQALVGRLGRNYSAVADLKVDTAIFYVFDGVKCPSILVEASFITNPTEEKRLQDTEYQWAVADGIVNGVKGYLKSRQALASSL